MLCSVADPDLGSWIRCFMSPGSVIRIQDECFFDRCISDSGSQTHIAESLVSILGLQQLKFFCQVAHIFIGRYPYLIENKKVHNFFIFMATKKRITFFSPPLFLFLLDSVSDIRDGRKSGSGIWVKHSGSAKLMLCI
jgi:hypothetical protein